MRALLIRLCNYTNSFRWGQDLRWGILRWTELLAGESPVGPGEWKISPTIENEYIWTFFLLPENVTNMPLVLCPLRVQKTWLVAGSLIKLKTKNEDHSLTNWAMPSDPIMEKWKWNIFRCPDGFHGDGETSCLPGDPEPSQVCLPCLRIFFVCIRYSSNQFGTDSCIFSNYIHTLVLHVRAMKMLYLLMSFLVQPENSDCRSEREACGDHAQCVYQVGEAKQVKSNFFILWT